MARWGVAVRGLGAVGAVFMVTLLVPATARALTWVDADASQLAGRTAYTQTVLLDGRVLVAGGADATGTAVATCALFDPASGQWRDAGSLVVARADHTATLLADGRVLVAGGRGAAGAALASLELYDPKADAWKPVSATLAHARWGHTATRLRNGDVAFIGGRTRTAVLASVERYTPTSGSVGSLAAMAKARYAHTATRLDDGRVMVIGGIGGAAGVDPAAATALAAVALFVPDAGSGTWAVQPALPDGARQGHVAVALPGNFVVIFGGFTDASGQTPTAVAEHLMEGGQWTTDVSVPTELEGALAAVRLPAAYGPNVAVVGGNLSSAPSATPAEILRPAGGDVTVSAKVPFAPHFLRPVQSTLPGGRLLVTSGDASGSSRVLEPDAPTVTTSPTDVDPCPAYAAAAPLPDGSVALFGGQDATGKPLDAVEIYTPGAGLTVTHWSGNTSGTPPGRKRAAAVPLPDGTVLLVGGVVAGVGATTGTLVYHPGDGSMTAGPDLGYARSGATATLLPDGSVLVFGGTGNASDPVAERLAPGASTFTPLSPTTLDWAGQSVVVLPSGKVLIAFGRAAPSAFLFDPVTDAFTDVSAPPALGAHRFATATLLGDGRVLVAGGLDATATATGAAAIYTPGVGWSPTGSMLVARALAGAVRLEDGEVLVAGGQDASNADLATTEIFDPVTGIWRAGPTLDATRRGPHLSRLADGTILVLGGPTPSTSGSPVILLVPQRPAGPAPTAVNPSPMAPVEAITAAGAFSTLGSGDGTARAGDLDVPRLWLESRLGGPDVLVPATQVSTTTVSGIVPAGTPLGPYFARVDLAGATGGGRPVMVAASTCSGNPSICGTAVCVGEVCCESACAGGTCDATGVCHPGGGTDGGVGTTPQLYGCLCGQGGSAPGWAVFLVVIVLLRFGRRRPGLWLVLLGAALASGPARAQSTPKAAAQPAVEKVAVLELQSGPGVDAKLAAVITQSLTAAIQARGVSVLSSQDIKAALGFEAQKQLLGCNADSGCLAQIGGALGVDHVVAGSLARIGSSYVMNLQLLNIARASVERRFSRRVRAGSAEAFLDAVAPGAEALFPGKEVVVAAPVGAPAPSADGAPAPSAEGASQPVGVTVGLRGQMVPAPPARGALGLFVGWRAADTLTVGVGGLAARPFGAYLRLEWVPFAAGGRVRPLLAAEVPLLFSSPVTAGVSLSPGVAIGLTRWLDLTLEVPVSYEITAPAGAQRLWVFLAGGLALRL